MPIRWRDYTPGTVGPRGGSRKEGKTLHPYSNDTGIPEPAPLTISDDISHIAPDWTERAIEHVESPYEILSSTQRPRSVAQQARHLERWQPFVRNAAETACDCCARHRTCIVFVTRWRHGQAYCEDCLQWLLKLLAEHDS